MLVSQLFNVYSVFTLKCVTKDTLTVFFAQTCDYLPSIVTAIVTQGWVFLSI